MMRAMVRVNDPSERAGLIALGANVAKRYDRQATCMALHSVLDELISSK
jgi:hypothetical protein